MPERAVLPLWHRWKSSCLVLCLTLVAYWPALDGDFLWDDKPGHVTRPELQSLDGLRRIWFEPGATQQYYPVLHAAFWLQHRLWGDAPGPYHVVNVLLHAAAACLFGAVLARLLPAAAVTGALLFALHPVGVESVAWISEQKNTLSTVFYLGAALAYINFDRTRGRSNYIGATALFLLALLTKSVTATLPAALLVVFWWQRGTVTWRRDILPLTPWFAWAALAAATTTWVERTLVGAAGSEFALGAFERGLLAGRILLFYLGKLVWPANLTFIYPRWTVSAAEAGAYVYPLLAIGVLVMLAGMAARHRGPLAAALLYAGSLFPALGFIDVYPFRYSYVADHFQYLPSLAVLALAGAGLAIGAARWGRRRAMLVAGLLLTSLAACTWAQSRLYQDSVTLFRATVARNPGSWMAHNNLATALADAHEVAAAIPHLELAIKLNPSSFEVENNLGNDLRILKRPAEAIPHLERALALKPAFPEAHNNLGIAFMNLGRTAEGVAHFEAALQLNPAFAQARFNLGLACANTGRLAEAISHFERAVALDRNYAEAEQNWGIGLVLIGRVAEAFPHFERALELEPRSFATRTFFGRALAAAGRVEEAIAMYRGALDLNPNHAEAHIHLSAALQQVGRIQEAAQHAREAARLGGGG